MGQDSGTAIYREWANELDTLGREVTISSGDQLIIGRAEAVDAEGILLVRTASGEAAYVSVGDVS
jgi:biotin-(acetyl-CoA carboxylase) ligase